MRACYNGALPVLAELPRCESTTCQAMAGLKLTTIHGGHLQLVMVTAGNMSVRACHISRLGLLHTNLLSGPLSLKQVAEMHMFVLQKQAF